MINISNRRLFEAIDATWAPFRFEQNGPFKLRVGAGGGKRVSAASSDAATATTSEIENASGTMRSFGQTPLFMLKPDQRKLDDKLKTLGFALIDPVVIYANLATELAQHAQDSLHSIPSDIPLAAQRHIWSADNIGPERLAVMERSMSPKTYMLGRNGSQIAGTVFVSCHKKIAMLHAFAVRLSARRSGVGRRLTYGCAKWAVAQGAEAFALVTTRDNTAARRLYESCGMIEVSSYHYRIKTE